MQSAGCFREQAALCLEIARHISDPQAVDKLRARAAEHFASAHEVERRTEIADSSRPNVRSRARNGGGGLSLRHLPPCFRSNDFIPQVPSVHFLDTAVQQVRHA
jgi:hypothetical protein